MPSQQNIDQLAQIKENLDKSQSFVIADYSGLNVTAQTVLRAAIAAAGGQFTVSKNRLVKLALKDRLKEVPESVDSALEGPSASMYGFTDAVAAIKALVDFAKDHDALQIKIGFMFGDQDQVLSPDDIKALSELPSLDVLRATLVARLNGPITGFVAVLSGTNRKLVYALEAIRKQKAAN